MKILVGPQFLGSNHSWSVTGWGLTSGFLANGAEVDLFSTDGIKHIPDHLLPLVIGYRELNDTKVQGRMPEAVYDLQVAYTAMIQWPHAFKYGRTKVAIWCYEWFGKNVLPTGWAKYHQYVDYVAAPSTFARNIFLDSGVPADKVVVIPHGIDRHLYENK